MTQPPFPTGAAYPEASQATTILVLGILGLLCCGPLGIAAWVMGNNELQAIAGGRRDPAHRGTANAGRVLGIIAVAIWVGLILVQLAFFPFIDLPFFRFLPGAQ